MTTTPTDPTTDDLRTLLADALTDSRLVHWRDSRTIADYVDALLPTVESYGRACAATALRDAADQWQQGAWADTPRNADHVADRIGAAQFVTDWLRARAQTAEAAAEATP